LASIRTAKISPLVVLGLLLIAWWFLPVFFKSLLSSGLHEFQAPAWTTSSYVNDIQDYWALYGRSKGELIERHVEMSRRLAQLELERTELERLRADMARIETLLDITPLENYRYEVARVVRRRQSTWWQQLVIRKGSLHGIEVNDPVVFAEGLLGKVIQVGMYTSTVELITSPGFRFSVSLVDDPRILEYMAVVNPFPGNPVAEIRLIDPDVPANPLRPHVVITSGLGGVFPRGIPVGEIIEMKRGGDGLYQHGIIQLPSSLNSVMEVAVLIPENRRHATAP
jgi:rod shape-determining protein MreC